MQETEPTLSSIEDYDTLKGDKKKVVWTVILTGLLIGLIILAVKFSYGSTDDSLPIQESIGKVPVK